MLAKKEQLWQAARVLQERIRHYLPARAQDSLRRACELVSPTRRRQHAERLSSLHDSELSRQVSPTGVVLAGPFEGMRLPMTASWGGLTARLAGGYEEEIADELRQIIATRPRLVLDVGAAEGYYAIGLSRALPLSRVIAFDIDPYAQRVCARAARMNGVRNLTIRGRIDVATLRRLLEPGAFVLCDCEGYEDVLLDPPSVPVLRQTTLLVELHEFVVPGVTARILARFAHTHEATLITAQPKTGAGRPHLVHLSPEDADDAVQEHRPTDPQPMQWVVLRPISSSSPPPPSRGAT